LFVLLVYQANFSAQGTSISREMFTICRQIPAAILVTPNLGQARFGIEAEIVKLVYQMEPRCPWLSSVIWRVTLMLNK
jgi:hypothetical protein